MKKALSFILTLAIIVSAFSTIYVSAEDVVLFADSFENKMEGWAFMSAQDKGKLSYATTDKATDGKYSVCLKDPDEKTYGFISKDIIITPGIPYVVTYDLFNVEGSGGKIFVAFFDADDKRISSVSFGSADIGVWKSLSKTYNAPKDAVKMVLYLTGNSASTGESYVDNIKVKYNKKLAETANKDVAAGESLFSESFENGIESWKLSNPTKDKGELSRLATDKASDGKNSVYLNDPDDKTYGFTGDKFFIEPGTKYRVSYDLFNVKGTGGKVFVAFFDAEEKRISSVSFGSNTTGVWKSLFKDFAAPADAVYMGLYLTGTASGTGESYVDNIKVTKLEATSSSSLESLKVISEINEKIKAAKPGDIIEIPDGTYEGRIDFTANGEENAPITLRAKNPGKVIFTGESTIVLKGSYLHTQDLLFEKCTTQYVFNVSEGSNYCLIKNLAFIDCNPLDYEGKPLVDERQNYILLRGQYNIISGCYFRGKVSFGTMIEVHRIDGVPDYHIIENCYFGEFASSGKNGYETVRIGLSANSLTSSYSTIRGCFFERCNGEDETISIKSGENYIYNNTLYNTQGGIVLRHGNGTIVKGNLVIGGDPTSRVTGVRIIGENHKVSDNYFFNTPVKSDALSIFDGNPNPQIHEYLEVKNVDVHNNTFVNTDTAIVAGEYAPSGDNGSNRIIPPQGKIYNNAIISYKGYEPLFTMDANAQALEFNDNYVYGKEIDASVKGKEGIIEGAFDYKIENGFLIPENGSGANIEEIKKAPKSPYAVMPSWVKELYYDTGKIKFEVVENDPFNNPDSKVEDLFPKQGAITVTLNSEIMKFDVNPQLINDRTMVPMRAIFEAFGAGVTWDEATASATANNYYTEIKITENSTKAYVNGNEYLLDSPAVIIDGRFLVPIRFISESFGATVEWIDPTQTVKIDYVINSFSKEFPPKNPDIANALTVYGAMQSGDDGTNNITYIFDGSTSTKWAVKEDANGNNGYGIIDLGSVKELDKLYMALASHATRIYSFEIYVSEDNKNYTLAIPKKSSTVFDGAFEIHDFNGAKGRYIKFVGYGNTDNTWNNITEFVVTGK